MRKFLSGAKMPEGTRDFPLDFLAIRL